MTGSQEADLRLISHWAKYACVRACGFLEEAVTIHLLSFAHRTADQRVARFVDKQLRDFQSPKTGHIRDLLSHFCQRWAEDFDVWANEKRAGSINSIVTNRHLVAHGDYSEITLARLRQYWGDAKELSQWLGRELGGPT